MAELRGIIERLEQATGPDRELDALLWASGLKLSGAAIDSYGPPPDGAIFEYEAEDDGGVSMYIRFSGGECRKRAKRPAPAYTASLDASIALVVAMRGARWWSIVNDGMQAFGATQLPSADLPRFVLLALLRSLEAQ